MIGNDRPPSPPTPEGFNEAYVLRLNPLPEATQRNIENRFRIDQLLWFRIAPGVFKYQTPGSTYFEICVRHLQDGDRRFCLMAPNDSVAIAVVQQLAAWLYALPLTPMEAHVRLIEMQRQPAMDAYNKAYGTNRQVFLPTAVDLTAIQNMFAAPR